MKLNEPLGKILILTANLCSLETMESKRNSHHTNSMVYASKDWCDATKQQLWDLKNAGYEVKLI
jgi:hypothetical protein